MNIIETFIKAKKSDEALNEDGLYIGDNFIAVVDGATNKLKDAKFKPTPGVVVKDIIIDALKKADKNFNMRDMQAFIDSSIQEKYTEKDFFKKHFEYRMQASAVIYCISKSALWFFGDCQALVNDKYFKTEKLCDDVNSKLRSSYLINSCDFTNQKIAEDEDAGRKAIMPFLKEQLSYANRKGKFGYFVFDGFSDFSYPVMEVFVSKGDEIVLATDGYPKLFNSLEESESYLMKLKNEDPLLVEKYKSTKGFYIGNNSFDDRSYIRFTV